MLYRVVGSPNGAPSHSFSDVPPWLTAAVEWIVDPGNAPPYATGFPTTPPTYRPDVDIAGPRRCA